MTKVSSRKFFNAALNIVNELHGHRRDRSPLTFSAESRLPLRQSIITRQ